MRPTPLQSVLSRLFMGAGTFMILVGFATAAVGTGDRPFPLLGTIVAVIGYTGYFGNYWILRNTNRGLSAATMLKVFLGTGSFGLLFAGLLNVFRLKDPSIPNGYLFGDGCVFGALLITFHLYTKRPAQT